jgi:hypothetical protein
MKKYSWIMALLLALTLAFIGCPTDGGGGGGGKDPGGEEPGGKEIQWGDEPGMPKPTLVGGNTAPVWDDETGIMSITASSNSAFYWTWEQLSEAAGETISQNGGNLFVFYVIEVIKPVATLTIKNPANMEANPGAPGGWGTGKGAEYVLGHNTLSNYQAGDAGKIVGGLYNEETGRGWFEINPLVYPAGSTGIGFQHNYWADTNGDGVKIAENSEYRLKIISILPDVPDLSVTVNLAAIPDVDAPIKGQTPVTEITAAQYTGTIVWAPAVAEGGTFAPDTEYTATITLTAKEGFTFEGVAEDFFTVAGADATNPANSGVVTAVFPKTTAEGEADTVTEAAILGVTAPVAGAMPVAAITAGTQIASGTVTWKVGTTDHTGAFDYETVYTAIITLVAAEGFTFDGVAANFFTVDGADATNDADSGVVTAVFLATGEPPYVAILEEDEGTLKHTNPIFVKYAGWGNSFTVEGNVVTVPASQQVNFAYAYPIDAEGFDIDEWDFVTLSITTTGTITNFGYKLYDGTSTVGGDVNNNLAGGRDGGLVSDGDATIKLEIRKVPYGLGFQKYSGDSNEPEIEITEAVFSKGTRYTVTLDANGGTVTPTTTYFVDGTVVSNHLPVPTQTGKTFVGWKNGEDWLISSTEVDNTFEDATLIAQWIDTKTIAPITVDLSTAETGGSATVSANTEESYTFSTSGYQQVVKFTLELGEGNVLANLDKVTFNLKGESGDTNYKTLHILAGASLADSDGGENPVSSVGSVYIENTTGASGVNLTVIIDKAKAIALTDEELEISIYVHGEALSYTVSNVVFSQNDE